MHRSIFSNILAIAAVLMMSACSASETSAQESTDYVPTGPILVIGSSGGCARGPHNACTIHHLFADGRQEWISPQKGGPETVSSDQIDKALVDQWVLDVQTVDWSRYLLQEDEQVCASCVDGVDIYAIINVDGTEIRLDSARYDWAALQSHLSVARPETQPAVSEAVFDKAVFTVTQSGGCARGGRCTKTYFAANGRFVVFPGLRNRNFEGAVSKELVTELITLIDDLDWDAFTASLGRGRFQAPSDGIDLVYIFETSQKDVKLDSITYDFDLDERLFQLMRELERQAWEAQRSVHQAADSAN